MKITGKQKEVLMDAWDWCDDKDKSTEFMLQYMADMAGVEYDDVVLFIERTQFEERQKRWKK